MEISKKDFQSNVNLIYGQWEVLKNDLYNGVVKFDDLYQLINNYDFFNRFNDMFKENLTLLEVPLTDIKYMYRGVTEEADLNNYERMFPKKEFSNGNNRMNPPGKLFLYLGILGKDKDREFKTIKKHVVKTILKETRATKNVIATICEFEIKNSAKNKKVIDIRGDSKVPMSESALNEYILKNAVDKRLKTLNNQKFSSILVSVYFNMFLSDQIYKPINTREEETKRYEYGPFHAIANYISEQGYAGIIYKSTVHQNGTNLVLFNHDDASIRNNTMEHVNTSNYL